MAKSNKQLAVVYDVPDAKRETIIPVPMSRWECWMGRLRLKPDKYASLEARAWALIGLGGGSFLAAAALPFSVTFISKEPTGQVANLPAIITQVTFIITFFACSVMAKFTFDYAKTHREDRQDINDLVLQDMELHKQSYLHADKAAVVEPEPATRS